MEAEGPSQPVESPDEQPSRALVVDTGAYCRSTYLDKSGCQIYVTGGIKAEIERNRQKNPLESTIRTLFTPIVREPATEDIAFVKKFASQTGDLPFLSENDIALIALTRRLQIETGDTSELRETPMTLKIDKLNGSTNGAKTKPKKDKPSVGFDCWIGAHNVNSYNMEVQKSKKKVSCMTTDFAMQNVLIQMGLNVVTLDGFVAKSIRRWGQMCRKFCAKCGNATVDRVPITIDSETSEIIAKDTRKWINTRGTIYTQPKPATGRVEQPYIVAEDQLMMPAFKNYMRNVNRKNKEDPLVHFYADDAKENELSATGMSAMVTNPSALNHVTVGLGKGNPNSNRWVQRHKRSLKSK